MNNNTLLWKSDLNNGTYQNPILYADFSDPDVIRVDDTFYMTASSFNYMPALPILKSADLIHWKLVNYAIKYKLPYEQYETPAHSKGVWAPSIRFHNGEFYIYFGMPDEGIFMVKTKDPEGDWCAPVLVLPGKGYIDPCPLWDDDGRAYIVHAYAKSRIGFKSYLGLFEMSPDGTKAISDDVLIFNGSETQITIEGPKFYKRSNKYYILAPAGGVKTGWQTALRSDNIYGPYEEHIVMHQGAADINGPHQGALIDSSNGCEWFIHFQDDGVYGRITHLQPAKWVDGWPVIGDNTKDILCGEPVRIYKKPALPGNEQFYLDASDDFSSPKLGLQWQWAANYDESFYKLMPENKTIRLYSKYTCKDKQPLLWNQANVLTQKLVTPVFNASVTLDYSGLLENEKAGLVVMGGEYASLYVTKKNGKITLNYLESKKTSEEICHEIAVLDNTSTEIVLKLMFNKNRTVSFEYATNPGEFYKCSYEHLPSDHMWTGAKIGIYSCSDFTKEEQGYSDFKSFDVIPE